MAPGHRRWSAAAAALVVLTACRPGGGAAAAPSRSPVASVVPAPTAPAPAPTAPAPTAPGPTAPAPTAPIGPAVVEVGYRVERHTTDAATEGFAAVVDATLADPRGWRRAGFRLARRPDALFVVLIGEPAEVERLCRPYDVFLAYSCQLGPLVAINAERWRRATPQWTGDLATYRQMLVAHEVGHLLGQHHVRPACPVPGRPAAVMSQQSTELGGCLPNPWPLDAEIERAARHDLPLAPPYEPGP